ncbi:ribosomal protein S18-alanine N-acetyltransferase [Acholeplasma hippikon]|uniref:[Ribosomal protein bS18]-alanine N-acetyltransferase n=1 Tax=Acholeplasma hippikon TaxID=264636 RepID=A0A449BKU1_9MOLU|nr:ribosomal protein S18-alanine N-acetyltransferase [Acholeplasma hippikon]VEU83091.1 ribosomal-protein-alanine N-acetyltransferase [Acholeplasma hippikon]
MIRKADLKDLETIVKLEEKIFNHSLGYSFLRQEMLENPFSRIFVYEKDDMIIGYISYRVIDKNADIINFLIDTPYQGLGLGKELFKTITYEMKSEGVESLVLEVRSKNTKAIHLYEQFGAKHIRTLKNYYGDDDAYMMIMEVK